MKKNISLLIAILAGLSVSSMTMAECPNGLSADEMVDCIVVEGAGGIHPKSVFKKPEARLKSGNISKSETKPNDKQLAKTEK